MSTKTTTKMITKRVYYRLDSNLSRLVFALKPKSMSHNQYINLLTRCYIDSYTRTAKSYLSYRSLFYIDYDYDSLDFQYSVPLDPDIQQEMEQIEVSSIRSNQRPFYYSRFIREAIVYFLITQGKLRYRDNYRAYSFCLANPEEQEILNSIKQRLKATRNVMEAKND